MSLGRNDVCHCGSGLKYKNCHYNIDNANPDARPIASQKLYDNNWRKNAGHYSSQGCYQWLAKKLTKFNPSLILDIGCGDGSGILALKREFPNVSIISLDENSSCIQSTKQFLEKENYEVNVINRLHFEALSNRQHEILIEPGKLNYKPGILLIEADILLDDKELINFLNTLPKFDVVTIWLIGSHLLRSECVNIADLNINTSGEYRLRVQNRVYEIADILLKKGGALQVVDRGEEPNNEILQDDSLNAHREQASVTNLVVDELDYITYSEPVSNAKIKMEMTPGLSGRIPKDYKTAMVSVISIKN